MAVTQPKTISEQIIATADSTKSTQELSSFFYEVETIEAAIRYAKRSMKRTDADIKASADVAKSQLKSVQDMNVAAG